MRVARILFSVLLVAFATMAIAQSTSVDIKSGTVITTYADKLVVRMASGEIKEITVPSGFKFNVDGKQLGLSELQPGTTLTAMVTTTKTPETVRTTEIKNGEVVKIQGSQLWVRTGGEVKAFTVPAGFQFIVDGKKVGLDKLQVGSKLSAEIVYASERTVTESEVQVAGTAPAPAPAPAPVAAAPPAELPKTAGPLPFVALLGLAMLGAGVLVRRRS